MPKEVTFKDMNIDASEMLSLLNSLAYRLRHVGTRDFERNNAADLADGLIVSLERIQKRDESFSCPLCGQRIDDNKPCECGARK